MTRVIVLLVILCLRTAYAYVLVQGNSWERSSSTLALNGQASPKKSNKPEKRFASKPKGGSANFVRPNSSSSSSSSSSRGKSKSEGDDGDGVRLNKCLLGLSRRSADEAIASGRVSVNGKIINDPNNSEATKTNAGMRVKRGDKIRLDGALQNWQEWAEAKDLVPSRVLEDRDFVYVKYSKLPGITCTSDPKDRSNIIAAGGFNLFPQRLFTVGRLDKDSSGLILLTSDGRVNNALLSPQFKKDKVYEVEMDKGIVCLIMIF